MEQIIEPVDLALIKAELTPDKKIGDTNKGGNELYVVTGKDSPNTLMEIGRLREGMVLAIFATSCTCSTRCVMWSFSTR